MRQRCFDLLEQSAKISADKLKFFRLAFGAAGGYGDLVPVEEARAVVDGGSEFAAIRAALDRARSELDEAKTALADADATPVIALHPNLADEYRRLVGDLRELLDSGNGDESHDAREKIRSIVDHVLITPAPGATGTLMTIEGRLAEILNLAAGGAVSGMYASGGAPGGTTSLAYMLKVAKV